VIVDGLEVLGLHDVGAHPVLGIEPDRDVADDVLDELRVVVGAPVTCFSSGPLEDAEQLARRLLLGRRRSTSSIHRCRAPAP